MKRLLIAYVFVSVVFCLKAQNGSFQAMGNASVMLYDFWGIFNNQAGLAQIDRPTAGVCYHNGFLIKETGTQLAGVVYPTKTGNFSASFYRYGYSNYSENVAGIGYSRKINEIFSAGVNFDYFYLNQSEMYKNKNLFLFEIGLLAQPIDKLYLGVHLYNPTRAKIADYQNERITTNLRVGLGYFFTDAVIFTLETEKSIDHDLSIKSGLSYEIVKSLVVKAGLSTAPNQFSTGLGYKLKRLTFDIAFTTHPKLPISSQAALTYEF